MKYPLLKSAAIAALLAGLSAPAFASTTGTPGPTANLQTTYLNPLDPATCVFSGITPGVFKVVGTGATASLQSTSGSGVGGTPARVTVNVTNVNALQLTPPAQLVGANGTTRTIPTSGLWLAAPAMALTGASTSVFSPSVSGNVTFSTPLFVDTPDVGTDSFELQVAISTGNVDALSLPKGEVFTATVGITCLLNPGAVN